MEPDKTENTPFLPDVNGYCYYDTYHFDKSMEAAASHLMLKHGSWIDRLLVLGVLILFAIFLLVFFLITTANFWIFVSLILLSPLVFFLYIIRAKQFSKSIIRKRICIYCGYSLIHTFTDDNGYGTCSECGKRFHLGYYRQLPYGYKRE